MFGVKHMKWWGWGVEGIGFNHENKPNFAPFAKAQVGLDVTTTGNAAPDFSEMKVPESQLPDSLAEALAAAVGDKFVITEDLDRVVHTFGKSVRDLIRVRRNMLKRVPDAVVYPADEEQVKGILAAVLEADAVLIPFGGGSNIAGSLEPRPEETRPIVSLDMGRMNRVLELDTDAGLARIQAGALGPALEEQLNRRGWTIGHFPDSFTHSTLGGWVATRSSGMQSDKYGDIADITRGLNLVTAMRDDQGETQVDTMKLRPLPSTSSGPSLREMVLGSEGRLGIITEVWVNVHQLAEERTVLAWFFPDFEHGAAAMQEISQSGVQVLVARCSDERETAFTFATQRKQRGVKKLANDGVFQLLKRRGWDLDKLCISFIGFEGTKSHVAHQRSLVKDIVAKHGGMFVGKGPGQMYDQKKFDTPYIRDFLLDRGAAADVSETAVPYSRLKELYDNTIVAAQDAMDAAGVRGYIFCHLSHNYHSGACLYFTFAIADDSDAMLENYDLVKRAVQQSFVDNGGTLSHHHGVGMEHSPWLSQDVSPAGSKMMDSLFLSVDPGRNLNPGKVVHDGEPGVSDLSNW